MFDILLGCFSLIQNIENIIGEIIKICVREAFHSNLFALWLLDERDLFSFPFYSSVFWIQLPRTIRIIWYYSQRNSIQYHTTLLSLNISMLCRILQLGVNKFSDLKDCLCLGAAIATRGDIWFDGLQQFVCWFLLLFSLNYVLTGAIEPSSHFFLRPCNALS